MYCHQSAFRGREFIAVFCSVNFYFLLLSASTMRLLLASMICCDDTVVVKLLRGSSKLARPCEASQCRWS